jgi:hypothetical protein
MCDDDDGGCGSALFSGDVFAGSLKARYKLGTNKQKQRAH